MSSRWSPFVLSFLFFFIFPATADAWAHPLVPRHRTAKSQPLAPAVNITTTINSGVCETTPGVGQTSGYVQVSEGNSIWYWFFESRNSPDTAPLTLWLNGGPGCSSMMGLFQENGPCTVNSNGETVLNPYSWNNFSNMIYIDQPIGAGFSFGSTVTNSSAEAAPLIWTFFQILLQSADFSKYQNREFIFATESFGAHFAPTFINYFNTQNAQIESGAVQGVKIVTSALMISDGKHDPLTQYASYIEFAANAPGYGPLQSNSTINQMRSAYYGAQGCQAQLEACYAGGSNAVCAGAEEYCNTNVYTPAAQGLDGDDLSQKAPGNFPPTYYENLLDTNKVTNVIGTRAQFEACDDNIKTDFTNSGELGRSFLPPLAQLVNAQLPVLIWVGDLDIKANWLGVHQAMVSMAWYGNQTLNNTALTNMTIDGENVAAIASVGNFTFARVYGAGHSLPAYVPKTAQVIFNQVVQKQALHSVSTTSSSGSASIAGATPGASGRPANGARRSFDDTWSWVLGTMVVLCVGVVAGY